MKNILRHVEYLEATAKALNDPFSSEIRIGMIPTIGPYFTPIVLPAIARLLPQLMHELREDLTEILVLHLIEGGIDAAFIATPVQDSRLGQIRLYDKPFWAVLPNRHPLTEKEAIDLQDFGTEEIMLLEDEHCFRDQVLSFCEMVLKNQLSVKMQKTSLTTFLALVGAGAGVTLVPAMSLSGSWVTDAEITLKRELTGIAKRSVTLAFRKSYPR